MKIKCLILFIAVSFCSFLNSIIHEIKQDGTGNFETIQAGVDASTDNDTILVYPGLYFENIFIQNKQITLGSLLLTTGDESYKNTTIIDGNESNSCLRLFDCVDTVSVVGFTLQHGIGGQIHEESALLGGGILLKNSNAKIYNCNITNNTADSGGGICSTYDSYMFLSEVSIFKNKVVGAGGGIIAEFIQFDPINLCNIYNNYASQANDFFKGSDFPFVEVIVDTFTVANPSIYYIAHIDHYAVSHPDLISLSMQNAYFEQIEHDLYVSPEGNDNNSGISEDEPFQTIAHALTVIKSDSLNQRTIHLANGVYSQSQNNQWLAIHPKGYVSIIGESMENTILDAENSFLSFYNRFGDFTYKLKNFTISNVERADFFATLLKFSTSTPNYKNVYLENIKITNSKVSQYLLSMQGVNLYAKNVQFIDNFGGDVVTIFSNTNHQEQIVFENCRIINHQHWNVLEDPRSRPIAFVGTSSTEYEMPTFTLINTEINNCYDNEWIANWSSAGIFTSWFLNLNLINCTIGDNSGNSPSAYAIKCNDPNCGIDIYNSIIYGNSPHQIGLFGNGDSGNPTVLNIKNSLIDPVDDDVYDFFGNNEINWLGGNLSEDPLWNISTDNQYFLSEDSPCIDAGTLELPDGIVLPEFDLAGNPRIYGNGVDMGAYEWNPNIANDDNFVINNGKYKLTNYPNPFNPTTTIKYFLPKDSFVNLSIYNIKGQKIKELVNEIKSKGNNSVIWNGKDENGNSVSSGVYFYKIKTDQNQESTSRMLLLK